MRGNVMNQCSSRVLGTNRWELNRNGKSTLLSTEFDLLVLALVTVVGEPLGLVVV